jgi:hypothetical protein
MCRFEDPQHGEGAVTHETHILISPAVNLSVTFDTDYTLHQMRGKTHMKLLNASCVCKSARTYIHLTNLFNGNEVLGKFSIQRTSYYPSLLMLLFRLNFVSFSWFSGCCLLLFVEIHHE